MKSTFKHLALLFCTFYICAQEAHDCPFKEHVKHGKCGYIEVPRNWSYPNGETTKLAYIVIPASKTSKSKLAPVFFLQGGPGGNVLKNIDLYSRLSLDNARDFVLFDQRGVGFSEEFCPDLNLKMIEVLAADLNIQGEIEQLKRAVNTCSVSYHKDKRVFNTETNAKDIEALRKYLGYNKINIFGTSYGTRLGLKYMELYPKHVRSAILSGVFPSEVKFYQNTYFNFNNSLNKMFQVCSEDTECNNRYSNLKNRFQNVYKKLKEDSLTILVNEMPFTLNQQDVLFFMHQMLYSPQTIAYLPLFIASLESTDVKALSGIIKALLPRITQINLGVYYSIMSSDEGMYDNQMMFNREKEKIWLANSGISAFSADIEIIKLFKKNSNTVKPEQKVADIPTLFISGDFDPITPSKNVDILIEEFKNSQHIIFKNSGHIPINSCFFRISKQFLNDPKSKIKNTSCNSESRIKWL